MAPTKTPTKASITAATDEPFEMARGAAELCLLMIMAVAGPAAAVPVLELAVGSVVTKPVAKV